MFGLAAVAVGFPIQKEAWPVWPERLAKVMTTGKGDVSFPVTEYEIVNGPLPEPLTGTCAPFTATLTLVTDWLILKFKVRTLPAPMNRPFALLVDIDTDDNIGGVLVIADVLLGETVTYSDPHDTPEAQTLTFVLPELMPVTVNTLPFKDADATPVLELFEI